MKLERIDNVPRRDWYAVPPPGLRVNPEHYGQPVVRNGDAVGETAVETTDLVPRTNNQRVGIEPESARCTDAPYGCGRQCIEVSLRSLYQYAPPWGRQD